MSLTVADNGGGDFERAPEGTHLATCYMVADVGTQTTVFNGQEKQQKKIIIGWELPHETMSDGRPFAITQRYTASLNEKASLRKDLEAWRGCAFTEDQLKGFSLSAILGKNCFLNIIHQENNGKTYTNVKAVMAVPKGTPEVKPVNPIVFFDMDEFDNETFVRLPNWIQELIKKSQEYSPVAQEVRAQTAADAYIGAEALSIPF